MFGLETEFTRYLLALAVGTAASSGVITWVVARRYGRRQAIVVPILALGALGFLVWRAAAGDVHDAMATMALTYVFAGPAIAGALVGLALSGRRG